MSVAEAWPALAVRAALRPKASVQIEGAGGDRHLDGVVSWIAAARQHASDGGIAAYFWLAAGRWTASYPETSGYTIPTLYALAAALGRPALAEVAIELAGWLLAVRTAEGGVRSWEDARGGPVVFDTGQVIWGWLATWRQTGDPTYLDAAVRAAGWLVSVQSTSGAWMEHQHEDTVKVIDTRVAWALLALAGHSPEPRFREAARRNLDWAIGQQQSNGWFRHAAFKPGEQPSTHALAYTAEGLLESGLLLGDSRYVAAGELTARALLACQQPDGSLAWKYGSAWQPRAWCACLTGVCQAALLWLRLHAQSPDPELLAAARRAIDFVAGTQDLDTSHAGVRGGIAGSWPIYGGYARMRYPNWAAKFFADALLALRRADGLPDAKEGYPG